MLHLLIFLITCFSVQASQQNAIHSEIRTIDSFTAAKYELDTADNDTLVIFDRDDTLLQGIDNIGEENQKIFLNMWHELYTFEKTNTEKEELLQFIQQTKPALIESNAPELIQELQNKNTKVVILTGGCHGPSNIGPNVEDLCINAFRSSGIDLRQSFAPITTLSLTSIQNNNYHPLFKNGIIFANTCNKGDALKAFLQEIGWQPKQIIFFDDKTSYLKEVQQSAQKMGIKFLGFEYTGAKKLPCPDLTLQCLKIPYLLKQDLTSHMIRLFGGNQLSPAKQAVFETLYRPTIYMPWRSSYLSKKSQTAPVKKRCPFCSIKEDTHDEANFVLARLKHCMVALNIYPYTKGHLLILPYDHVKKFSDLSDEARNELTWLTSVSSDIIQEIVEADGANIGINLGKAGGASIPDHLHVQIVPRFEPDNLGYIHMTTDTALIGWNLKQLYNDLTSAFGKVRGDNP